MRNFVLFALVLAAGCTRASDAAPEKTPAPKVAPKPPKPTTRVELTAVTLADDCGGTTPMGPPAKAIVKPGKANKAKADSRARRRCEQTSMQLAITAADAARLHVKSVELFDESGKSLGTLTATKPTRWSETTGIYEAWDESFAASTTLSVSYVLSQPNWDSVANRWNKTFTLKTVLSVGGVDQTAQKDVTLTAPTSLPPNVKT